MDTDTTLDNLGTPRTENWLVISKILIGSHSQPFNFWLSWLFGKFQIDHIWRDW